MEKGNTPLERLSEYTAKLTAIWDDYRKKVQPFAEERDAKVEVAWSEYQHIIRVKAKKAKKEEVK